MFKPFLSLIFLFHAATSYPNCHINKSDPFLILSLRVIHEAALAYPPFILEVNEESKLIGQQFDYVLSQAYLHLKEDNVSAKRSIMAPS